VLTERRGAVTEARARNYERLRARLSAAAGEPVEPAHYEEVEAGWLARASAVVLSGASSPWALQDPEALARLGEAVVSACRPVLGICAGMQLQVQWGGGAFGPGTPEAGFLPVAVRDARDLLRGLADEVVVFHDHSEEVTELPDGFRVLASSPSCAVQAIASPERRWWGTQFHPEEYETEHPAGEQVLRTFFALARD
jgi:GMP synthase (glutamine-hydrolysing)